MIDHFGREITYLRLSVTELCNLRCRYCMPAEGVCKKSHEEMLTEEEMIGAVHAAARLGVNKVRITGGEPLVKRNILSICEKTACTPGIRNVCITTNGVLLPPIARDLKQAGVNRINLSLDTLDPEKYRFVTRRGELGNVLKGLESAIDAGFDKIKINVVLIGGFNDTEVPELAALTLKYPVDVRFIELMPMYDSGDFGPEAFIPGKKILEQLPELTEEEYDGGVARLYRLPGALGNVGLINPLSAHFCKTCNRIRITADGMIKPCLHREAEYSIRGLTEEQMLQQLRKAISGKPEWHGELSSQSRSHAGRNMNQIGG